MLSRPVSLWNLNTGTCEPAELDEDGIPLAEADPLPIYDDVDLPDAKGTPAPKSSLVSRFKVSMCGPSVWQATSELTERRRTQAWSAAC